MAIRNTTEYIESMDLDDMLKLASGASAHILAQTGKDIEFFIGYNDEIHVLEAGIQRFSTFNLDHAIETVFETEGLVW